ncbi:MAG: surface-adhesin E family protein [Hassallia sp.]
MFKQLAMTFLINLCFLSPAHAENWVLLGNTEGDNRPFYLDTDSIQGSNGYYQYWYSYPDPDKNVIVSTRFTIACRERMIRIIAGKQYTPNGRLIEAYNYGNNKKPLPILAGSTASLVWETICR